MNNQKIVPDTLGMATDKRRLELDTEDRGNPVLVRPVTVKDIQEM